MKDFAFYLFIFSIGSFIIPIISRYIRIPVLVGEILYGMLLRALLYEQDIDLRLINFLSEMGFIFIMFLAGIEIDFDRLKIKFLGTPSVMILVIYITSVLIYNYILMPEMYFLVILLTASSVGIIFIVLKSNKAEQSVFGQTLIWTGTLGELLSITFILIFEMYHLHNHTFNILFFTDISKLLILIAAAYFLMRLILLYLWWFPSSTEAIETSADVSELGVRMSFLILLTMVALSAYFHLEYILGAFLGGMMISFVFRDKKKLESKLSSIGYGFFIPFFFMKLGWDFGIEEANILNIIKLAVQFYIIIFLIRLTASFFILNKIKHNNILASIRTIIASAFLLAAPLTLLVAAAKVGYQIEEIDEITYKAFILCAIIGGLLGPIGFSLFYRGRKSSALK
ncbi:MAG: cation:proton antiporter [Spirochaetia bacterium]|nr:cation:proton antiporter [Spirochaetia bacterium]